MIPFINQLMHKSLEIYKYSGKNIVAHKIEAGNWATETDIQIEKYILNSIRKKFPSHALLSEETMTQVDSSLSDIWLIDPLDGTTNFSYGIPFFGTAIAYMKNEILMDAGVINLSTGDIYTAILGKGAYKNGKQLHVKNKPIRGTMVCTGSPYSYANLEKELPFITSTHRLGGRIVILGSAVIESMLVCENIFSLYFEIGLKPWDIAASSLLIEESGGKVCDLSGKKINIFNNKGFVGGNKASVNEFVDVT